MNLQGDALLIGYEDKVVFDQADYISAIQQMGRENGLNNTVLTMLQNLYAPLAARDNYYNASTRVWGDGKLLPLLSHRVIKRLACRPD